MNTLDRKLWRDVVRSRGLLAAIISIVVVGVMCYITMQSAYRNLESARVRYYTQCRMADFWVDLKKLPRSELPRLARLDPTWELQGRIQFFSLVDIPEATQPVNGLLLSIPWSRPGTLNQLVMRQGGFFSDPEALEVILNDGFARHHGFQVGDRITLILNQKEQPLLIVGTALSSEFTYLLGPGALMPDPESFGVFYLPQDLMEQLYDFDGACNQLVGRWPPQGTASEESLQLLEDKLESYGVNSITKLAQQTSNQYLTNEIAGLKAFATVLPLVFLLVAAVVLNVLVSRLVRQQRPIIGTLKALGYTDRQVSHHFLKLGIIVGVLGGLFGSLTGYALSAAMTEVYSHYFEFPDLRAGVSLDVHVVGWCASLVCSLAGCWNGARHALRLHPAEAMRPATPPPLGHVAWEHWLPGWQRWSPVWRLAIRNLWRQKSRSLTAVFSCSMGAGLLVAGMMMLASQNFLIDFQFYRTQRSHLDVAFDQEQGLSAIHELRQLPQAQIVEPVFMLAGDLRHEHRTEKMAIQGLTPQAQLTIPRDRQGSPLRVPEAGIVIDRKLAEKLDLSVGDLAEFKPTRGERKTRTVSVAKISDGYLGLSCYANIDYLSRSMGESFVATGAQLRVDGSAEDFRRLLVELRRRPEIRSVISQSHISESLRDTLLKNQWVMIATLILFSGVIYFGSILNSSLVSLTERQREVATLRAVGYGPLQIGWMFFRESLITNGLGTLLGMPIGYGLVMLTAWSFNNDLIRLPIIAPSWIWGVAILTGLVFGFFAQAMVQRAIFTANFVDALKLKE